MSKKSKLELKIKTIANLSNLEMSYLIGGGDDDGDQPTRKVCGKTLSKEEIEKAIDEANKIALSKVLLIC